MRARQKVGAGTGYSRAATRRAASVVNRRRLITRGFITTR
jgi:hypothetical protein